MPLERVTASGGHRVTAGAPGSRPPSVHRLLGLQATAGNRAVARLVGGIAVQRCGAERHAGCPCAEEESPVQRADLSEFGLQDASTGQPSSTDQGGDGSAPDKSPRTLTSPRFAGDAKLEACLNDQARLGQGDVSQSTAKVQQALIDLGQDLGPTGADLVYGPKTAAAVRSFKTKESLGFTQFGDVGPGTMARLDELLPGEVPQCPILGGDTEAGGGEAPVADTDGGQAPVTGDGAQALVGGGTQQVRAGAPLSRAFGIPGLLCQIKPTVDPVPQNLGQIKSATRTALALDTARREQTSIDGGYQVFRSGFRQSGNLGSTTPIFGDGVTQGTTDPDRDIRDGLVSVASLLVTAQPKGLPVGTTTTLTIGDVPGRNGRDGRPIVQPGGIFRFTHLQLAQGPHMLMERLGDVSTRAPGAATATTAAAFAAAFAAEGFTLVLTTPAGGGAGTTSYTAAEIRLLDQGLRRHGTGTLARINGTRFDKSGASQLGNEEGSYTPATRTINLVAKALAGTASNPGGFTAGQFTLNHEVGHALADRDAAVMPLFITAAAGTPPLTDIGKKNSEENFAECIALHAVDRAQLAAMRPAISTLLSARYP